DTELIEAMRRGSSAQITAVSSRGTQTIDDFSLLGFTAALEKAEELCQ
ncbi:MAG: invasion associated locus B family protein, partial [Pseudomonadota bacterium]